VNSHLPFEKVLPFKKARAFARKLKLGGQRKWKFYIEDKSKKLKTPARPDISPHYKKEWKNWGDFLGKENKKTRKHYVNDNFFKKWSPNMAYVFGLWFADGSIIKHKSSKSKNSGNIFNITLHKDDKYLLENVLRAMGLEENHYLYKNRTCYFINIFSNKMVKDIIKLGGKYRKSLDCKFPHVPKKYLPDFIRGEFDGDGCIYYDHRCKSYRAEFSSGSKRFINELLSKLRKNIPNFRSNIRTIFHKSKTDNSKITPHYNIYCATNDTKRLGIFMYQNNPRLKMIRKYDLFQKAGTKVREFWPYEKVKKYVKKLNIESESKWRIYYKSGNKPAQVPSRPDAVYKNKGWTNWTNYLGYNNKKGKQQILKNKQWTT